MNDPNQINNDERFWKNTNIKKRYEIVKTLKANSKLVKTLKTQRNKGLRYQSWEFYFENIQKKAGWTIA